MGSIQDRAALPRLSSGAAAAIAVAGLAGTAVAFGVALDVGHADHDGLVATGRASAVLIPVAVGLHQWRSRAPQRFAPLLVLARPVDGAGVARGVAHACALQRGTRRRLDLRVPHAGPAARLPGGRPAAPRRPRARGGDGPGPRAALPADGLDGGRLSGAVGGLDVRQAAARRTRSPCSGPNRGSSATR